MHRVFLIFAFALGLTLATPTVQVFADSDHSDSDSGKKAKKAKKAKRAKGSKGARGSKGASLSSAKREGDIQPASSGSSVPELDMTFAGSSVLLLLGGIAYFAARRRDEE